MGKPTRIQYLNMIIFILSLLVYGAFGDKPSLRWIASGGCATTDVAYPKEMLPVTQTENPFDCMSICFQTVGCGYINWCSPGISNCDNDCALFSASLPITKGNGYPGHNCYAKNTYTGRTKKRARKCKDKIGKLKCEKHKKKGRCKKNKKNKWIRNRCQKNLQSRKNLQKKRTLKKSDPVHVLD